MFISREIHTHKHNGILFSHEGGDSPICDNMDGSKN